MATPSQSAFYARIEILSRVHKAFAADCRADSHLETVVRQAARDLELLEVVEGMFDTRQSQMLFEERAQGGAGKNVVRFPPRVRAVT